MRPATNVRWIACTERLPTENETVRGRVPALDSDGVLVTAMLISGDLVAAGVIVAHWLPAGNVESPVTASGDLNFNPAPEPKCGHCGRGKGNHQAKTQACPVGRGCFPAYDPSNVFTARVARKKSNR